MRCCCRWEGKQNAFVSVCEDGRAFHSALRCPKPQHCPLVAHGLPILVLEVRVVAVQLVQTLSPARRRNRPPSVSAPVAAAPADRLPASVEASVEQRDVVALELLLREHLQLLLLEHLHLDQNQRERLHPLPWQQWQLVAAALGGNASAVPPVHAAHAYWADMAEGSATIKSNGGYCWPARSFVA